MYVCVRLGALLFNYKCLARVPGFKSKCVFSVTESTELGKGSRLPSLQALHWHRGGRVAAEKGKPRSSEAGGGASHRPRPHALPGFSKDTNPNLMLNWRTRQVTQGSKIALE